MIRILRETWRDLGRSILVGERYEKNMRGIMLVALLIVTVNLITGGLNLINGYYSAAATSPMFILAGLPILCVIRAGHRYYPCSYYTTVVILSDDVFYSKAHIFAATPSRIT